MQINKKLTGRMYSAVQKVSKPVSATVSCKSSEESCSLLVKRGLDKERE